MSTVGTTRWGAQRGGRLTAIERAGMILALASRRLAARFARRGDVVVSFAETSIALPDTALTRDALAHCESECAPAIFNHSVRCYAWGVLLAEAKTLRFDREALAVAALLHDVELGRTERRDGFSCTCFACAGAEGARKFLRRQAVSADQCDLICDAIALHLNPAVPLSAGAEAHLLNAGAALDVVGAGLTALHPDDRARVLAAYPRNGFKRTMRAAMERERAAAPDTRAALLMKLGFAAMIESAPFDS